MGIPVHIPAGVTMYANPGAVGKISITRADGSKELLLEMKEGQGMGAHLPPPDVAMGSSEVWQRILFKDTKLSVLPFLASAVELTDAIVDRLAKVP